MLLKHVEIVTNEHLKIFFLYPEYDPDLSQKLITSSFDQPEPHNIFFEIPVHCYRKHRQTDKHTQNINLLVQIKVRKHCYFCLEHLTFLVTSNRMLHHLIFAP